MTENRISQGLLPIVGALAGLVVTSATAAAAPASDVLPPDLAKAAKAYDEAQITGDRVALERLVADDYVLVNSRAHVEGKAELIDGYATPGNSIERYVVVDKMEKRLGRDAAVLSGKVTLKGLSDGAPFTGQMRFADVWQRRRGAWKVVFTEVTRVPPPQ